MGKQLPPIVFLTALVLFCMGFTACGSRSDSQGDQKQQLSEIARFLEVEFPSEAIIIRSGKNDRNNELAYYHMIYTPDPVKFKKPPVAKITAENSIKNLEKVVGARKLGNLVDKWKFCYEGEVKNGEWRAIQTNFDTGSYLEVEQFYF